MAIAAAELVKQGMEYRWTLTKAGVPVLDRCSVVAMTGEDQVENAVVASVDPSGRQIVGTEREFEVDAVCLGYGFIPSNEIARALGCDHHVDPENGALVTTRSNTGRTSVESVWVIGDAGDVFGAYAAEAQGAIAGSEVASELGLPAKASKPVAMAKANRSLRRHRGFQRGLQGLYKSAVLTKQLADDETIVCRCESVTLKSITRSFSEGVTSAGASKRVTRAGMGKCQGRYCSPTILALAHTNGFAPDQYSGFAPQAPVRPIEITRVAGSISPKNSKRPT